MTLSRSTLRSLAPLCLVTLLACRQQPAAGAGPYASIVAQAVPAIEHAVGLKYKTPPRIETRSKEQVRQFVLKQVTDPEAQRQFVGMESAYKLFGMIPDTMNLRKFLVDLLTEQVVGFYDPGTKVLYVVDGAAKDAVQVTVTHELVHALQDQYIDLNAIQKADSDNDRQEAAQAVFEGQAVYEQLEAMLGSSNVALNLPGGWDRVRQMIRENQSSMPIYASAPLVIQETLLFPYLSGAEFIKTYKEREHNGVPYVPNGNMPLSTTQIMHPSLFFGTREDPTPVSFAPTHGVTPTYTNDLGEFETRLLLFQYLNNQDEAVRGATGWNGDRYMVFNTPTGRAIAWASVWDTEDRAATFDTLIQRVISARKLAAPTRLMQVSSAQVAGRSVVLYVDVPAGADPNVVTLAAVRLGSRVTRSTMQSTGTSGGSHDSAAPSP